MSTHDFSNYLSPLSWRYGSDTMRTIFSEQHKYELWRKIWVALARAQAKEGLISKAELADLVAHQKNIGIERILTLEKETKHDVMAAIREFAEVARVGGGKIHVGATSMDIVDNAEIMRTQEALELVRGQLGTLIRAFAEKVETYADLVCMGYTHLQPAEPTTVGYRFAFYTQEFLLTYDFLGYVQQTLKTKGMKGAVGTQASYKAVLGSDSKVKVMEEAVLGELGLTGAPVSTQINSRLYDYLVVTALSMIAAAASKFAADVRLMQSPTIGEWAEPFGKKQVGSSAMPFKKNPVTSEKICSLARLVIALPQVVAGNAQHSYLERTLDDSANKRIVFPEAFLCADEILTSALSVISGLQIFEKRIAFHVAQYGPFAATEAILMEAVKKGASRQEMHDVLRTLSLQAWDVIAEGKENPLETVLIESPRITKWVAASRVKELLDPSHHVGTAPALARRMAKMVQKTIHHGKT